MKDSVLQTEHAFKIFKTIPHHFAVLATVSLLSTFLKLLHEWEDKEKRKTVIISVIGQGGLRMMDFEIMNKALKIAWIKRLNHRTLSPSLEIIPEFTATKYDSLSFLTIK